MSLRQGGYDLTHYNLGVRRDTSRDITARWDQECSIRLPNTCQQYVVFSFGVNDTSIENGTCRVDPSESIGHFRRIIEVASSKYSVAVVGPPPIADVSQNTRIRTLSDSFAEAARHFGIPYLSVFESLEVDPVWMSEVKANDGAHPGARGYARMAKLVLNWSQWWFKV